MSDTNNNMLEEGTAQASYQEAIEQRRKELRQQLRRHKMPESLSLEAALTCLTKQELDDIRYNLNLPTINIDRIKKADIVAELEPELVKFAGSWFVSIVQEQKDWFDYACQHEGRIADVQDSQLEKMTYLQRIGIMLCGMEEGRLVWYMPEEIQAEYARLNNGAFVDAVNVNTEIFQLAKGMTYYYGLMDYRSMYSRAVELSGAELGFEDFMKIIFNVTCWDTYTVPDMDNLRYSGLMNPELLLQAREARGKMDYADIPYDKLYDAGQEEYIESTQEYRSLAQWLMTRKGLDVLQAAELAKTIFQLLQNGYGLGEVRSCLGAYGAQLQDRNEAGVFDRLVRSYYGSLRHWVLKGHTLQEAEKLATKAGRRAEAKKADAKPARTKIGRNDPCPCGSGKKYKNCCLKKTY